MVIMFLAFFRRLFTVSTCSHRVITFPFHATNCSCHMPTCLNQLHYHRKYFHPEDWSSMFLRNACIYLQFCVVSQHTDQKQNILQSRHGFIKWAVKVGGRCGWFRDYVCSTAQKISIWGSKLFALVKTVTSSRLYEMFRAYLTEPECLRDIELYTSSEDREVHCVVAVLIPLIRNP